MIRGALLPFLLLAASCGGIVEPFTLTILSSNSAAPIIRPAVDRIDVIIEPARDVAFEDMGVESYDNAETRINGDGHWELRLDRAWIDENWQPNGSTFLVDVPLYHDGGEAPEVPDPTVRILFRRSRDNMLEVIGEQTRMIPWPLEPGGEVQVQVQCSVGFELPCRNQ